MYTCKNVFKSCRICACPVLLGNSKLFSKWFHQFILSPVCKSFLHRILTNTWYCQTFYFFAYLMGVYLILTHISLITTDIDAFYLYLQPCMFFHLGYPCLHFLPIFSIVCLFLLIHISIFWMIFIPLLVLSVAIIFCLFVVCFFVYIYEQIFLPFFLSFM